MPIDFEEVHRRFDGMLLNLCRKCGGFCEKNYLSVFLPGETEYMAHKIKMGKNAFIKKYATTVKKSGRQIHVLKIGLCPFLDQKYRCRLEKINAKPLSCLFYPIYLSLEGNQKKVYLDKWGCPMADRFSRSYTNKARELLKELKKDIPDWWFKFLREFDDDYYDYGKLHTLRGNSVVSPRELKKCVRS